VGIQCARPRKEENQSRTSWSYGDGERYLNERDGGGHKMIRQNTRLTCLAASPRLSESTEPSGFFASWCLPPMDVSACPLVSAESEHQPST
jgi:hypothetical protein